ncbi:hypothetical protein F5887DRAFT_1002677, partial [Amanita rubescens]
MTGDKGLESAWKMIKATDELLHTLSIEFQEQEAHSQSETLVMSTGVIGQHLIETRTLL